MTEAIIYTRLSLPDGDTGSHGLAVQLAECERWCKDNAASVLMRLEDNGVSGSVHFLERPAFKRETAGVPLRGRTLVVWRIDRLFRSLLDFAVTLDLFEKQNVRLVSVSQPYDVRDKEQKAFMAMLVCFAELERAGTQKRVKAALDAKRERGEQTCPYARYGWKFVDSGRVGRDGRPIMIEAEDDTEREWIRTMKAWKRNGLTLLAIANRLNDHNVPTRRGGPWAASTVRDVVMRRYSWKSAGGPTSDLVTVAGASVAPVAGGQTEKPA